MVSAESLKVYLLSIIPLFIAMGAIDAVPFVISLTQGMDPHVRKRTILESSGMSAIILLVFLFIGKGLLFLMGVSVSDFMIAGGLLLTILSTKSLMLPSGEAKIQIKESDPGIVPLATPLIAGPAAMATTLILLDRYGLYVTLFSVLVNCLLAWLILKQSYLITRFLGQRGTKAISKVSYVLLASIGVMMMRQGLSNFISK